VSFDVAASTANDVTLPLFSPPYVETRSRRTRTVRTLRP
jgi:hypothetical protein